MLAIIINRATEDGQISGFIPHLVDDRLSILQYVDELAKAGNMKLILTVFEKL